MTLVSSDPGQWAELFAAFDTLAELDTGARAERLDAIGSANPEARRVLEELLDADANESSLREIDAVFGYGRALPEQGENRDLLKLVGQTVAHFRIIEPLGAGGMGVVYRAIDVTLGRAAALKFSLPGQQLDRNARDRLLREARAAASLDHPNICSIYETGETADGQLFFAMPLYEGATLKARIAHEGVLPVAEALAIAEQMARGLHAAHRAGIVHRDLKPANVMVLPDGAVKILDFGVARIRDVTLTTSRGALGTVSYMAPEQIRGAQTDGRADLWALGVVLYEMLTGNRPFDGAHEFAVAHAIVHTSPDPPSTLRSGVSPALDAMVLQLLAKDPSARPQTAEAVVAHREALASTTPYAHTERSRHVVIGRRALLTTVAAVVDILAVTSWRARSRAADASDEPRLVTVLPFESESISDDADFLGPALAGEIAARLSRLRGLGLTGESLAVRYGRSGKAPLDIAQELAADAVVTGSVRRMGDELRLEVTVFAAGEPLSVWTQEYRGRVAGMLELQRRATQDIAGALEVRLSSEERAAMAHQPTQNAQAYELYLRGRAAQIEASLESGAARVQSLRRAQSYFAQAREADVRFAEPRARLAMSHLAVVPYDSSRARHDQSRIDAEAALRLNAGLSEAHEALASYWLLLGDRAKAISELELALAGRPNAAHLHRLLGVNLSPMGRLEEAASAYERASRLEPTNRLLHHSAALMFSRLRRYQESIAHWDMVIAMDSGRDPFPQFIRGQNYLRYGNIDSLDAAVMRIPLGTDAAPGPACRASVVQPGCWAGITLFSRLTAHRVNRRYARALLLLDSARAPITFDTYLYRPVALLRAQTLEEMGDLTAARASYERARALLEEHVATHPRDPRMRVALGLAYAGLRRHADARRQARIAMELAPVSVSPVTATAHMGGAVEIYARLGDADAALELIELLLAMPAGREASVPLFRLDPTYDRLRSDPRFDALLARFSRN